MAHLVVEERHGEISVLLHDGSSAPRLLVRHPFDVPVSADELAELRWYLEEYSDAPFGAYQRQADRIRANLDAIGMRLYKAAFGALANKTVDEIAQQPAPTVCFSSASSAFLSLPWELVRDSSHGSPLALSGSQIYRCVPGLEMAASEILIPARARVLFVVSRPGGLNDVSYSLISRPVAESLRDTGLRIDVLRPPSADEFAARLGAARDASDPYSVVHFDGHGALNFDGATSLEGSVYFEGAENAAQAVTATWLAEVLSGAQVQLAIFNACESARIEGATPETVVASALMRAGIPAVLGMAYSVQASTAQAFMKSLYMTLASGSSLSAAMAKGRESVTQLHAESMAQDWFVPVLYAIADVRICLQRRASDASFALADDLVGRDPDFYALETAIRTDQVILVHGIAGVGKSRLIDEFSHWLEQTGWSPSIQAVRLHAPSLTEQELDEHLDLVRMELGDSMAHGERVLMVIDELDQMDPSMRSKVADLIQVIRGGKRSLLLLASRTNEHWLPDTLRLPLASLQPFAAAQLFRPSSASGDPSRWIEMCGGLPSLLRASARWDHATLDWPTAWDVDGPRLSIANSLLNLVPWLDDTMRRFPPRQRAQCRVLSFLGAVVDSRLLILIAGLARAGTDPDADPGIPLAAANANLPCSMGTDDITAWHNLLDVLSAHGVARLIAGSVFEVHPLVAVWALREWTREQDFDLERRMTSQSVIGCLSTLAFGASQAENSPLLAPITSPFYRPILRRATFAGMRGGWPHDAALIFGAMRVSLDGQFGAGAADTIAEDLRQGIVQHLGRPPDAGDAVHFLWLRLHGHASPYEDRASPSVRSREGEARRLLERTPRSSDTIDARVFALHTLGAAAGNQGDLQASEKYYRDAIEEAGDPMSPQLFSTYRNLALIAFEHGRMSEAKELLATARLTASNAEQRLPVAEAIEPIEAILELHVGDPAKSLDLLDAAAQALDQIPSLDTRAATSHELGLANLAIGRLDQAEHYFKQSLMLKDRIGRPSAMTSTFQGLGQLEAKRGDLMKAEAWFRQGLENAKKHSGANLAALVRSLADNLALQGRPDEARNLFDYLDRSDRQPSGSPRDDDALLAGAEHAQRSHDHACIVRLLEPRLSGRSDSPPMSLRFEGPARGLLAEAYMITGRFDEARNEANAAVEKLRRLESETGGGGAFSLAHALGIRAGLLPESDPVRIDDALEAAKRFIALRSAGTKEAVHYLVLAYTFGVQAVAPGDAQRSEQSLALFDDLCSALEPGDKHELLPRAIVAAGRLANASANHGAFDRFVTSGARLILRGHRHGDEFQAFAECLYVPTQQEYKTDLPINRAQVELMSDLLAAFGDETNACRMLCGYLAAQAFQLVSTDSADVLSLCCQVVRQRLLARRDPHAAQELAKLLMYLATRYAMNDQLDDALRATVELHDLAVGDAGGAGVVSFAYAARNVVVLLIEQDRAEDEVRLSEQLVALGRGGDSSALSDLLFDYFGAASNCYAGRARFGHAERLVGRMQALSAKTETSSENDFKIVKSLLALGQAAMNDENRAVLDRILSQLRSSFARTSDPRTAGGLMWIDYGALRLHAHGGDVSRCIVILSEMIKLWTFVADRIAEATDGVVGLLGDALSATFTAIAATRDQARLQAFEACINGLDWTDPRLARIKARLQLE